MCVCSPFKVNKHLKVCELAFTVNIHMSTKTCVTGNNVILHEALLHEG